MNVSKSAVPTAEGPESVGFADGWGTEFNGTADAAGGIGDKATFGPALPLAVGVGETYAGGLTVGARDAILTGAT